MTDISDQVVVKIIDTINLFDKVGDGKLPVDSLMDCLRALGLSPADKDFRAILQDLKDEGWERLDVEDFLPIYDHCMNMRKPTIKELTDGINAINAHAQNTGFISADELMDALTNFGDKLTHDEVKTILDPLTEASGDVSVKALVSTVTEGAFIRKS